MADVQACRAAPGGLEQSRVQRRVNRRQKEVFSLVGHECPYGSYPAPLVPIGRIGERLVAVYPGGIAGPAVEEIPDDAEYVKYSDQLRNSLERFNFRVHRLFGFSDAEVEYYPAAHEARFLTAFLGTVASEDCTPAVRRMLEQHLRKIAEPVKSRQRERT